MKGLLQGVGVFCRKSTDRYSNFVPEIRFPTPSSWQEVAQNSSVGEKRLLWDYKASSFVELNTNRDFSRVVVKF